MENIKSDLRTLVDGLLDGIINNLIDEVKLIVLDEVKELVLNTKQGYTIKEFSAITGITVNGVKGRIKRKTLRAVRDGNVYLIPLDEVNRYTTMLKSA